MKKIYKALALMIALVLALSAFASCGDPSGESGSVTIVLGLDTPVEYEVDISKVTIDNGLFSVLDYLKSEGTLSYEASGTMISSVGDLKPDASKGEYIYIYTSCEADFDVSDWKQTMEYKGMELVSSGVGANDMTICDGDLIYIGTIIYG